MFGTVVGQLDDKVLSACRQDKSRWSAIEADNDLIILISMLEKICAQNMTGKKVFIPYRNLFTIEKCLAFTQRNNTTTTEFALQVNSMYASMIHQNGKHAFGLKYYDLVHFPRSTRTSNQIIISVLNLRRILHAKFPILSNILILPASIIRTDTLHTD
jgi:hypothetical protein